MKSNCSRLLRLFLFPSLVVLCIFLSISILAACNGSTAPSVTESGLTVSGKVLFDTTPLSGVKVNTTDGVLAQTDKYGIFAAKGLKSGEVLRFALDGYSFSPSSYTVGSQSSSVEVAASLNATATQISVAGHVKIGANGLNGVNVFINGGLSSATTTSNGLFLIENLSANDSLSFSRDGYTFTPSTYTVGKSNDYSVIITAVSTQGGTSASPKTPPTPSTPSTPPCEPPEAIKLTTPFNASIVSDFQNNKVILIFYIDYIRTRVKLYALSPSTEVDVSFSILDASVSILGTTLPVHSATFAVGGKTCTEICIDVKPLLSLVGNYSFALSALSNDGDTLYFDSDQSVAVTYSNTPSVSAVQNFSIANGIASWGGTSGATYTIIVDGVAITTTQNCSYNLTALCSSGLHTLRIVTSKPHNSPSSSSQIVFSL